MQMMISKNSECPTGGGMLASNHTGSTSKGTEVSDFFRTMEVPKQFLEDVLKSVLQDLELDPSSKYEFQRIEAHLLLSSLHRVAVYNDNGKILKSFIFKCLRSEPDTLNETFDSAIFFQNETNFYTEILKEFEEFQKKRLHEVHIPFQSYPKCYKTLRDGKEDVIVLEDLKESGYVMLNRTKVLDVPELFLLMKEFGRFHALSLAIKDKEPALFSRLKTNTIRETVFYEEHLKKCYADGIAYAASDILKLAKETFPPGSRYVSKLQSFVTPDLSYKIKDIIHPNEEDDQYNVFTHGDVWINNLLFHYQHSDNRATKKPDKMSFVDFQQCRYGSLALDLSAVLFLLMDQDMRENYRDEVLRIYYNSLKEFLGQLGCDPEKLFPFSALDIQLSKYSLFNLGMAFLLPYWLDPGEESDADIPVDEDSSAPGESVLVGAFSRKSNECRKRILDVIKESVDRGYLC